MRLSDGIIISDVRWEFVFKNANRKWKKFSWNDQSFFESFKRRFVLTRFANIIQQSIIQDLFKILPN